jgi:hypothetical protein
MSASGCWSGVTWTAFLPICTSSLPGTWSVMATTHQRSDSAIWNGPSLMPFRWTSSIQKWTNKGIQNVRNATFFRMCLNTTSICLFYWAFTLPAAFTFVQTRGRQLFPGGSKSEAKRVSSILQKVLKAHKHKVLVMGYNTINDIGINSIWKGTASYLASLPGGPSPAVICLWGS